MIIIGAKGFANELVGVLHQLDLLDGIVFFDDVNIVNNDLWYNRFEIIHSLDQVKRHFKEIDTKFILGIGNPHVRKKLSKKFESLGGELHTIISPKSFLAPFEVKIGKGSTVITGSVIDNNVNIGLGCLVNTNTTIGHDTTIGAFSEICPGAVISGNCIIGSMSFIGSNATLLPNVSIGNNVIVGAGSVVTKNIPNNCLVMGIPAKVIKELEPLPQEMYD